MANRRKKDTLCRTLCISHDTVEMVSRLVDPSGVFVGVFQARWTFSPTWKEHQTCRQDMETNLGCVAGGGGFN